MVEIQIKLRGIQAQSVLDAMTKVPRHLFVPKAYQSAAYEDTPLPIGHDQTISQPYIVAFMTEAAEIKPTDKVLEIGTGSGYQAAVLAEMCREVDSIEIVEPLAKEAANRLKSLGYRNVSVRIGDGYQGWPEKAPFDAILVTAAPEHVPEALQKQLAPNGRLIIPIGKSFQELVRLTKKGSSIVRESLLPVRFVPMTGEALKRR